MEASSSGNGDALLIKMRALARRGATLRRAGEGHGSIEQAEAGRQIRAVSPEEFLKMLDAGWLRSSGADAFVISRRGATALKGMLNRQAASLAGATATSGRAAAASKGQAARKAPVKPSINLRESPIAWLRQHRDGAGKPLLSQSEFEAGERLRRDFERAHLTQRVTASWDPTSVPSSQSRGAPGLGLDIPESALAARQRVEAAIAAVGPEMAGMLLDVCCYLKGLEQAERNGGWPRRAGKVVLQLGLAHLARHYGFERAGMRGRAGEIRSWGAADYRPSIDGPDDASVG